MQALSFDFKRHQKTEKNMKQSKKEEEAKIKMHRDYQRRTFIHPKHMYKL